MEYAGIVKGVVMFDQSERILDAAQTGLGLAFPASYPKPINLSAR